MCSQNSLDVIDAPSLYHAAAAGITAGNFFSTYSESAKLTWAARQKSSLKNALVQSAIYQNFCSSHPRPTPTTSAKSSRGKTLFLPPRLKVRFRSVEDNSYAPRRLSHSTMTLGVSSAMSARSSTLDTSTQSEYTKSKPAPENFKDFNGSKRQSQILPLRPFASLSSSTA